MTGGQLLQLLAARVESGNPLRVGLIGAGKFGTMFLSQARRVPGLHVLGIADLSPERASKALRARRVAAGAACGDELCAGPQNRLHLSHRRRRVTYPGQWPGSCG